MADDIAPILCSIEIDVPPEAAFRHFVEQIGRWWPLPYTWSGDRFERAAIEASAGGRWGETDIDGTEAEWGEVRIFEPGLLVLSFNISPERRPEPPERQSEVSIRFLAAGDGRTLLELEHRDLAKHGEGAAALRQGMASPQGWPMILASFRREMRYASGGAGCGMARAVS